MNRRIAIADALAGAGSLALAVGMYSMASLGECSAQGDCSLPMWVTVFGIVGGMLLTTLASLTATRPLGIALAFLGPAVGSIAGRVAGYRTPTDFVVGVVFTTLGLVMGTQAAMARVSQVRDEAARAAMRPGVATVLSVRGTGTRVKGDPVVWLELRVQSDDLTGSFTARIAEVVSRSAVPDPDDQYRIRYNHEDRSSVVLGDRLPATPQPPPGDEPAGRPPCDLRRPEDPTLPPWGTPEGQAPAPACDTPGPIREPDRASAAADRLDELVALRRSGVLTQQEFLVQSARVLDEDE